MNRTVVHVTFDAIRKSWVAKVAGFAVASKPERAFLLDMMRDRLNDMKLRGFLGQLVVHTKSGKIAFEHTYGADPKRSRG